MTELEYRLQLLESSVTPTIDRAPQFDIEDADTINGARIAGYDAPETRHSGVENAKAQKIQEQYGASLESQYNLGEQATTRTQELMQDPRYQQFEQTGELGYYGRPIENNQALQETLISEGLAAPTSRYDEKMNTLFRNANLKRAKLGLIDDVTTMDQIRDYNIESDYATKDAGFGSSVGRSVDAFQSGTVSTVGKLVDFASDIVGYIIDPKGVSTASKYLDKFGETMATSEYADKVSGYDRQESNFRKAEIGYKWEKGDYVGAILDGAVIAPETLAESLPMMFEMLVGFSGKAKVVGKVGDVFKKNSGFAAVVGQETNAQAEEYEKLYGEKVSIDKLAIMTATNTVMLGLDRLAFKDILGMKTGLKKMVDIMPAESGSKLIDAISIPLVIGFKTAQAGGKEAAQEYTQTWGEILNTHLEGNGQTISDILNNKEYQKEAVVGAVVGMGAGGLTGAGGQVFAGALNTLGSKVKVPKKPNSDTLPNVNDIDTPPKQDTTAPKATPVDIEVELQTVVEGLMSKKLSPTEAISKFDDLYSATTDTTDRTAIETMKTMIDEEFGSKEIEADALKLGSEAEALDMIEDIILYSENPTDLTEKNINKMAEVNDITPEQVKELRNNLQDVEIEAVNGPRGYKTFGKKMRKALAEGDTATANKFEKELIRFEATQRVKLETLENAKREILESIASGTQTEDVVTVSWNDQSMTVQMAGEGKNRRIKEGRNGSGLDIYIRKAKANIAGMARQLGTTNEAVRNIVDESEYENIDISETEVIYEDVTEVEGEYTASTEAATRRLTALEKRMTTLDKQMVDEVITEEEHMASSAELHKEMEVLEKVIASDKPTSQKPTTPIETTTSVDTTVSEVLSNTSDPRLASKVDVSTKDSIAGTFGMEGLSEVTTKFVAQFTSKLASSIKDMKAIAGKIGNEEAPAQGLLFDKDGNINSATALAMLVAKQEYIAFNSNVLGYKNKADIARLLGLQEAYQVSNKQLKQINEWGFSRGEIANTLGQAVATNLGIKPKKGVAEEEYKRVVSDLGNMVIETMLTDETLVETEVKVADYVELTTGTKPTDSAADSTMPFIKFNTNGLDFRGALDKNKATTTTARELYKSLEAELSLDASGARREPSTTKLKPKTTYPIRNNDIGEVSANAIKDLNELRQMKHTKVDSSIDFIKKHTDRVKALMGFVSVDTMKNSSQDTKDSQEAKNAQIEKSIEEISILEGDQFYFDWFYTKNYRYMMDSNTVNPQSDTLHRFIVVPDIHNVTLDSNDVDHMNKLKYALAQAVGYDVDKESTANVLAKGQSIIDLKAEGLEKVLMSDDLLASNEMSGAHVGHFLQAIQALEALESAVDGKFNTTITAEFDALTSGFGIKLMQFPILKDMQKWLSKVGVFVGKKINGSMNDELSKDGFDDSYQTLAKMMKADNISTGTNEATWNAIKGMMPQYTEGKVHGDLRKLFKDPFMTFNYSAGFKSIRKSLSGILAAKVLEGVATGNPDYKAISVRLNNLVDGDIKNLLRSQSADNIRLKGKPIEITTKKGTMKIGGTVADLIEATIDGAYGQAVEDILTEEFEPFIELGDHINTAFRLTFENFQAEYDTLTKGKSLSKQEKTDIAKKLIDKFPVIKGPLSEGIADGVTIFDTAKDNTASENTKVRTKATRGNVNIHAIVKKLEAAQKSGSVIPIHSIDASVISELIRGGVKGQFIHDAVMPNLLESDAAVNLYNEKWFKKNKEYFLVDEVLAMIESVPMTEELQETADYLTTTAETIRKNKKELFSDQDVDVGQMVGMKGGVYNFLSGNKSNAEPKAETKEPKTKYTKEQQGIILLAKETFGLKGLLKKIDLEGC
jgi:hypothetical protein